VKGTVLANQGDGRRTATQLGVAFAAVYAGVGVLWILVSDTVASSIAPTAEGLEFVQRYKGIGFIVVTAVCLLLLVRHGYASLRAALNAETAAALEALSRRLEVRVAERTKELRFVNEELDAFACTAAHDLKTPLSGIIGMAEILRIRYKPLLGPDGDRMTSLIQKSATDMATLVDDLLALSRVATHDLKLNRVDLAALAGAIVDDLRAAEPMRKVAVSIRSPMHVQADEGLVRSLMSNLIGNAWKFTAKEASAHIEVGCDDTHVGWVIHFVKDNGAGFAMDEASRVFEPFQRFHAARDFAGTGVGLATCQRIVRRHGGSIWISSKPGEGATVYFSFNQAGVRGHPPTVPEDSFFATSA
jgi:signal transduction histidine kinase